MFLDNVDVNYFYVLCEVSRQDVVALNAIELLTSVSCMGENVCRIVSRYDGFTKAENMYTVFIVT